MQLRIDSINVGAESWLSFSHNQQQRVQATWDLLIILILCFASAKTTMMYHARHDAGYINLRMHS